METNLHREAMETAAEEQQQQQPLDKFLAKQQQQQAPPSHQRLRRRQSALSVSEEREIRLKLQQQQQHEEIELLQRAKQQEIDMAGNPEWREQLRRELEAEISRRVREALDTPPAERQRRSRELARLKAAAQRERELTQLRHAAAAASATTSLTLASTTRFYGDQRLLRRAMDVGGHSNGEDVAQDVALSSAPTSSSFEASTGYARRAVRFRGNATAPAHTAGGTDVDADSGDFELRTGDQFAPLPMIPTSRQLTAASPALLCSAPNLTPPVASAGFASEGNSSAVLRRGLEAMRQFGDLSTEERLLLFSNFTRDGFRQACVGINSGLGDVTAGGDVVVGRLPDGSVLTRQPDGRYRDQYGLLRDQHGPFWPRDFGPCHPTPKHRRLPAPDREPLLLPLRNPGCEPLLTIETQTTPFTGRWRGTQIVYDSERCPRHYTPAPVADGVCPSLVFESRFESGNLRQVRRVGMFEYELLLRTDLYTKRHTQWFYFKVQNAQPKMVYKFVILNLLKSTSLYGSGMKPLMYSERAAIGDNLGWHRTGHHIRYSRNVTRLQSTLLHREMVYYQLEWQMEFPHPDDSCYLAHSYPYTYSDLRTDLLALQTDASKRRYVKEEVLCHTRAGNSCFLLTVTEDEDGEDSTDRVVKPGVVVTARVHPGESNSSWMMKGLIDFLTGDSATARALRKNFLFKLVPMLNPDGVIVGNYRTSLAARDLNRNYRHPRPEAFPTVFHTKRMLERLQQQRPVLLYCDLHGHSRKPNVFMYGCDSQYRGVDAEQVNSVRLRVNPEAFLNERLFPWLVSRCSPSLFSYRGCKFNIRKCKEATGRVVMWRQFGIENSFTMEATFSGTCATESDSRHFNTEDLESMGRSLASALWQYKLVKEDSTRQCSVVIDMTFDLVLGLLRDGSSGRDATASTAAESKSADDQGSGADAKMDRAVLLETLRAAIGNGGGGKSDGARRSLARLNPGRLMQQLALGSVEDCSSVIRQLNIVDVDESDSSDSDSESEPELPQPPEPSAKKRKRKLKKKDVANGGGKKRDNSTKDAEPLTQLRKTARQISVDNTRDLTATDVTAENDPNRAEERAQLDQQKATASKPSGAVTSVDDSGVASGRVKIKQYPMFVSKFEGRTNNGIPCFSEERLLERANKKIYSLHSRLNQERGRDIIYSHVDEIPSETNASLATLEEIRYRLQHLLASQDDAGQDDFNSPNGNGNSGLTNHDYNGSDSDDAEQKQPKEKPQQQQQQQVQAAAPNQSFVVVRPVQSLRPAKILQRRRSISHFGRSGQLVPGATSSPPTLERSLPSHLMQQQHLTQQQQQHQQQWMQQLQHADAAMPTASQQDSVAIMSLHSRARAHKLPQLRERHNRMLPQ